MWKWKGLGVILIMLFTLNSPWAQENIPDKILKEKNDGLFLSGLVSTNGFGGNVAYMLNKRFTLRGGYESLNINGNFDFDENEVDYDARFDYASGAYFLLADYYYTPRLYITGGAGINTFNPVIQGNAASNLEYGDIIIPSSRIGDFEFSIKPGVKISPYAGLGVRSFIGSHKRLTFSFEAGSYYIGAPQIEITTSGLLSPTSDPAHGQKERLEGQIDHYKFYPVLKLALGIRLF